MMSGGALIVSLNEWSNGRISADLEELVKTQLAPFQGTARVSVRGPRVALSLHVAQGIAINELATNAVKYGALSSERGSVELTWEHSAADEARGVQIYWRKLGADTVAAPVRSVMG